MPTRIYLKETGRCAKTKFKSDSLIGSSRISREADVILEIDHKKKTVSIIANRYGSCGEVLLKKEK